MLVCVGVVGWRNDVVVAMLILKVNGLSHHLVSLSYRTICKVLNQMFLLFIA